MALFWKGKTRIIARFLRTDFVIHSHSREGKNPSYSRINAVNFEFYGQAVFGDNMKTKKTVFCRNLVVRLKSVEVDF